MLWLKVKLSTLQDLIKFVPISGQYTQLVSKSHLNASSVIWREFCHVVNVEIKLFATCKWDHNAYVNAHEFEAEFCGDNKHKQVKPCFLIKSINDDILIFSTLDSQFDLATLYTPEFGWHALSLCWEYYTDSYTVFKCTRKAIHTQYVKYIHK